VVLSGEEIVRFLQAVPGLRNRAALRPQLMARGCGCARWPPSKLAASTAAAWPSGSSTARAARTAHVDRSAPAFRADQPRTPIGHRRLGTVSPRLLSRIGLNLMAAVSAPNNQAEARAGSVAQRHQRPTIGFHPRRGGGSINSRYRQSAY
jgi:hypothetical protein